MSDLLGAIHLVPSRARLDPQQQRLVRDNVNVNAMAFIWAMCLRGHWLETAWYWLTLLRDCAFMGGDRQVKAGH